MKNTKTKIILSAIVFLSATGFAGIVVAAGPSLYVSPANLTKTVGNDFSVSVGVNTSGTKVCAIEGTLVFNNLSCQSIIVTGDVISQSSPTCSNPHFLIGVPSCTTSDKILLTALVKAGSAGAASINFTAVDIIGEGVSLGSASISGNYTISAVSKPIPALTPASVAPKKPSAETPTPTPTPTPAQPTAEQPIEQPVAQAPQLSLLAAIGGVLTLGTGSVLLGILVGLIILAIVIYAIYAFIKRKRKNFGKM